MSEQSFASTRLYDKNGAQVTVSMTVPVNIHDFADADAQGIQHVIDTMLKNGFQVDQPGAQEGERIETFGWLCRRGKIDRNGDEISVIDFYLQTDNPEVKYKTFSMYLNNAEDTADFEAHTGLVVSKMSFYDGDAPLQRTSDKAPKYLVKPAIQPLKVALIKNPAYNPDETDISKRKPQFKFSRWLTGETAAPAQPATNSGEPPASSANAASGNPPPATVTHWATSEIARKQVADAFAKFGVNVRNKEALASAMILVEPGVTKLSESKFSTADAYIAKLNEVMTKAAAEQESEIDF